MKSIDKHLILFGPITLFIEWTAILLGTHYISSFNPNIALSTASTSPNPLPLIFGITLTLVGITYFLFGLSFRHISRKVPLAAFIAGIAFTFTGWVPYSGKGGISDVVHNTFNYIAVSGYIAMIWFLIKHPLTPIGKASKRTFIFLLISSLIAFISLFIIHQYIAIVQLVILISIQIWTLIVVWHVKTKPLP